MGEMASRYRNRYMQTIYAQYIDIYCVYMHLYAGHILAIVLATISSKVKCLWALRLLLTEVRVCLHKQNR